MPGLGMIKHKAEPDTGCILWVGPAEGRLEFEEQSEQSLANGRGCRQVECVFDDDALKRQVLIYSCLFHLDLLVQAAGVTAGGQSVSDHAVHADQICNLEVAKLLIITRIQLVWL